MAYFNLFVKFLILYSLIIISKAKLESIKSSDIDKAIKRAERVIDKKQKLLREQISKGNYLDSFIISAEARHQLKAHSHSDRNFPNHKQSILEEATVQLARKFNLNNEEIENLKSYSLKSEIARQMTETCIDSRPTNCTESKYQTFDGSCNNRQRPNEGRTFTCHRRLIRPDYADGIQAPRTGVNGTLPEPRVVSWLIHRIDENSSIYSRVTSTFFMSFGQFLDHDMEFTTQPLIDNQTLIQCCPESPNNHPNCLPIRLDSNDPDFPGRICMNFVRDASCSSCNLGFRDQMNSLTSIIDASQIYGTDESQARSLRTLAGDGKLDVRTSQEAGEIPLASRNPESDQCSRPGFPCFLLGDFRANQNLGLLSMHIIFMRFHNYVADTLRSLNGRWNGEKIYQEARRIVRGCFQHIIYNEYLPLLLGPTVMGDFTLSADNTKCNESLSLSLFNYFVTAAFRFGHSTVPEVFYSVTEFGIVSEIPLRNTFFNPIPIYQGLMENIIRGSTWFSQDRFDRYMSQSVTRFLYQRLNVSAMDLASINIQRGREHGLPGYTSYLLAVHNFNVRDFSDLFAIRNLIKRNCRDILPTVFNSVHDIDLFAGLLCEIPMSNAVVGPTAAYLLGKQFHDLKYADCFFYTHRENRIMNFSPAQKRAIQDIQMSSIICSVTNMPEITIDVMLAESTIVRCSNIPRINLSPWQE